MFGKKNNEIQSADYQYSVSGVENVTKRSGGKKIAAIAGASAAVLVGGSAIAYTLSDAVKNQVRLRVMKPENYYAWVNEKNSEELGALISEHYRKALEEYENGMTGNVKIAYLPSDEVKDMFLDEIIYDRSDADDEEKKLIDVVGNISEIAVNAELARENTSMKYSISAGVNKENIVSVDIAGKSDGSEIFTRIPQLSEKWIGRETENVLTAAYLDILRDPEAFLSPEDVEKEINRYVRVWNDFADDVEIEKKETVNICDIEVGYTVAEVELSEKDMDRIALRMLTELRDDDIIRNIAVNKLEMIDSDEYDEELDWAIEELQDDLKSNEYDNDTVLTFCTYIDGKGVIRGFSAEYDETEVFCAFGKDGDEIRGEYSINESGDEDISVKLYATEESDKTYSGKLDITTLEYDYDRDLEDWIEKPVATVIEFDSLEIVNEDKLYVNGYVTVKAEDIEPVSLQLDTDGDSQDITYELRMDDKDYGKLVISYSFDEGADVSLPDRSDAYMMGDGDSFELKDYASKDEFESFVREAFMKIGFDKEMASEAAEAAAISLYSEFDFAFDIGDNDFEIDPDTEIDFDDLDLDDFDFEDFDFDFGDFSYDFDYDPDTDDDYDFDIEDFEIVLDPAFSAGSFAR